MRILVVICFGLFTQIIFGQDNEFRSWNTINLNQKINDQFSINSDFQYRSYEDLDQMNQVLLRAGLGYNLTPNNNTILAGYALIFTRNLHQVGTFQTFTENRFYQQYQAKHILYNFAVNHRFRFEERLMNDDIFFRLRYQFSATLPLNKTSLEKNAFYFKIANELFLNSFKTNEFDRNRLNINAGFVINQNISIEAGYMKQHVKHIQTDHMMIGLTINNPI